MSHAGKRRTLARNQLGTMPWKDPEVAEKVDRRVVTNRARSASCFRVEDVGGRDRDRGGRLVAMLAAMY